MSFRQGMLRRKRPHLMDKPKILVILLLSMIKTHCQRMRSREKPITLVFRQKLIQPTKPCIEYHPNVCPHCGCLEFEDESVRRIRQFIDTVRDMVDVLHFTLFEGTCANCGAKVVGKIPEGFEQRYGPGFHTLLAWLNSKRGVTRRHLRPLFWTSWAYR